MATLTQQSYNNAVYDLIDAALTANPSGVQAELAKNNFSFPYGQNAQLAEKYLLQLYQNNTTLFWEILSNVKIDSSRLSPSQKDRLSALVPANASSKSISDYFQQALDYLKGTKTEGSSSETTTETSTGAYVAYVLIVLAIIGIAIYLFKTVGNG